MTTIDTRRVDSRREIRLGSMDELAAEAQRVAQAEAAGRVRTEGNWSPGQVLQHIARFMTCSLDGFPGKMPAWVRAFGWVLRRVMGRKLFEKSAPPGFKLPAGTAFLPEDEVSAGEGAAELCAVIDRVRGGEQFVDKSPFLGRLTREEWISLHLRHAELHLSFVVPEPVDA